MAKVSDKPLNIHTLVYIVDSISDVIAFGNFNLSQSLIILQAIVNLNISFCMHNSDFSVRWKVKLSKSRDFLVYTHIKAKSTRKHDSDRMRLFNISNIYHLHRRVMHLCLAYVIIKSQKRCDILTSGKKRK